MFTGIIEDLGTVVDIQKKTDLISISIESKILDDLEIGDSISVNGVCLTIVDIKTNIFMSDIVNETLLLTNLKDLSLNDMVNLEKCMKLDDRINGHIVQGHVESQASIVSKINNNNQTTITLKIDEKLLKYCIYKGSVCLDGISLTIAKIKSNYIDVAIIPHTLNNTTLLFKDVGDNLNLETDMLAKYAEKQYTRNKNAIK